VTSLPYTFRLTEEIGRWAFEVHLHALPDWYIAFTNPTAGPWKRLMARDEAGVEGEVHRFEREEDRPDLVLVNDRLSTLLIIEAKDSLGALVVPAQVTKSAEVVKTLAETLSLRAENAYWLTRSDYQVLPGLLWGAEAATTDAGRLSAFQTYASAFHRIDFAHPGIVGIEITRAGNQLALNGYVYETAYEDAAGVVLGSLDL
jgi:hypothetical protein